MMEFCRDQGTVTSIRASTLASSCHNLRGFVKSSIAQKTSPVKSIITILVEEISATHFWCDALSAPDPHPWYRGVVHRLSERRCHARASKILLLGQTSGRICLRSFCPPNDFCELCPFLKAPMVVKVSAVTPIRTWLAHLVAHASPSSRTFCKVARR